jgi:hypothetical protein
MEGLCPAFLNVSFPKLLNELQLHFILVVYTKNCEINL